MKYELDGSAPSLSTISKFLAGDLTIALSAKAKARIKASRNFVEKCLDDKNPHYGINTGFGRLATTRISTSDLAKLQVNYLNSHSVGVGDPFPPYVVRLMMLLRANMLAMGYSGIRYETIDLLIAMINSDIVPIVPEQGSVGASGDLAPLAHIALVLTGDGHVFYKGKVMTASKALKLAGLKPIELGAKEALALTNGTQAMLAVAALALIRVENLLAAADIAGALSVEGDRASDAPFDERIHLIRAHPGQIATAKNMRALLADSGIIASHVNCMRVQDPYSFRCIPQVHGAVRDAVSYARDVIVRELGSCTDNPIIFHEDEEILSGGNFHGEPIAIAMDVMGIAIAELGSISERRVAILTAPLSGELDTKFLVEDAGLNSGLMIAHVTMSALASENKSLSHPASVDSIPTSGGQEDHVSMGTIAARKALNIISNCEKIIGIELLAASQAIYLQRKHGKPGRGTLAAYDLIREEIPPITGDRAFKKDIDHCIDLVVSGDLVSAAEKVIGRLI